MFSLKFSPPLFLFSAPGSYSKLYLLFPHLAQSILACQLYWLITSAHFVVVTEEEVLVRSFILILVLRSLVLLVHVLWFHVLWFHELLLLQECLSVQ